MASRPPTKKPKLKNFSSFDLPSAYKQLGLKHLTPWTLTATAVPLSDFLRQRLERLQQFFDLRNYEESRKLIIDALCEEALITSKHLKFWKGAALKSDCLNGNVDYLLAENKDYLEAPFLCIVEAKKDDFEKGLAQCLVEMQACQWNNQRIHPMMDVFGIVTNGDVWRFYKLVPQGIVYETLPYSTNDIGLIIGILRHIFETCDAAFPNA